MKGRRAAPAVAVSTARGWRSKMSTLKFFKNARSDGGVRTGVALDDEVVLEGFKEGREPDPALVWYVDLTFESDDIPAEVEAARQWLLLQRPWLATALDDVASKLEVGIDQDWSPFSYVLDAPRGVKAALTGAAMRSVRVVDFAEHLRQIKDQWARDLRRLKSPAPSSW
jgi:hypothetical protein